MEKIRRVLQHGVFVIDDDGEILKRYGKQPKMRQVKCRGMSDEGNEFFICLYNDQYSAGRMRRIAITESANSMRSFDALQENGLDRSEPKFLAVAVAANAVLLNATDNDRGEQEALIETLGVMVDRPVPNSHSRLGGDTDEHEESSFECQISSHAVLALVSSDRSGGPCAFEGGAIRGGSCRGDREARRKQHTPARGEDLRA